MKIRFDNNSVNFSSLEYGEVFCRKYSSDMLMKIEEVCEDSKIFNAVFLTDGKLASFDSDALVKKIDSELIIK